MKKVSIKRMTCAFFLMTIFLFVSCSSISQSAASDESRSKKIAALYEKGNSQEQIEIIDPAEVDPVDTSADNALEPENALNPAKKKPMVALTFDDGPFYFTEQTLDILERHGVQATFFLVGKEIAGREASVIRAAQNGNEIACHTWDHKLLTDLSSREIAATIKNTNALIERLTGIAPPSFFRPPYGHVNARVANVCAELGYSMVNWTVDPQDWLLLNADKVYDAVMKTVRENSIILLHEIFASTVAATERIILSLIEKGYQLVTLSELLTHVYGELKPGMVYGSPGLAR